MKIKEQIHEILRSTWARDLSADDAADEIESLFLHIGEMTMDCGQLAYVALDDRLSDFFEDGKNVFILIDE